MATRFMSKALVTAALGIALSPLVSAIAAPSPAWSNTAEAIQLDSPAAPSNCRSRTSYSRRWRETTIEVTWRDNSGNETGFIVETWLKNLAGEWIFVGSESLAVNSTAYWFGYDGGGRQYRFRVKAFSASGDSSWSNWSNSSH